MSRKSQIKHTRNNSSNNKFSINNSRRNCVDPFDVGRKSVVSNGTYLSQKKKGYITQMYSTTPPNGCSILYPNTTTKRISQKNYLDKLNDDVVCSYKVATNSSSIPCETNKTNNYIKQVGSLSSSEYTAYKLKQTKNLAPPCPVEPIMKVHNCSSSL